MGELRRRLLIAAVSVAGALGCAQAAHGAGMVTHQWMADRAIAHVQDPALRAFLQRHRAAYLSGAAYPDGGYAVGSLPGADYGEVSHWEEFHNALIRQLRATCGRTTRDPAGACADRLAHALGASAHGIGDQTWDWLFEPAVKDHGETGHHTFEDVPGFAELAPGRDTLGSIEYQMDTIALAEHGRWLPLAPYEPGYDDLLAAYRLVGRADITREGLLAGHHAITAVQVAERAGGLGDSGRVRRTMPWSAANIARASGGIDWSSRAIAGVLGALWTKASGNHPAPRAVAVHPLPGETGVTTRFRADEVNPGPSQGGAESRILVVVSNSVDAASVTPQALRLLDPAGREVLPLAGYPKAGPYHTTDGTHSLVFHPGYDLTPCTRYTAVLAAARLRDHAGQTLAADHAWSFTTRSATGDPCPGVTPGPATHDDPAASLPVTDVALREAARALGDARAALLGR